jgi:NADH:ubiquinone oxidoreductase subunit 2 (subunit N)
VPQGGPTWWLLAGATAALVLSALVVSNSVRSTGDSWTAAILLDLAELAAVALVWSGATTDAARSARRYLGAIAPAIACTLIGAGLLEPGAPPDLEKLALCLLVFGFALKLAWIPLYFWLPDVAAHAPVMTTALIVSVVDIGTLTELAGLRARSPRLFEDHAAVWTAIALLSMYGGVLLALAQRELKRMLAFSTIADVGLLVLGLVAGGATGLSGASIGALNHAMSKVLLFGAVGLAEQRLGRPVTLDTRGLAARLPVPAAVFVIGALGFIGVPPGFGFGAYWRIDLAAAEYGGPALLAAVLLVAVLDLFCYARAIHRSWLGPAHDPVTGAAARLASAVLVALAGIAIGLGVYPGVLTAVPGPVLALVAAR